VIIVDFEEATKMTLEVVREIRKDLHWDSKERFMNLVEEVGELANAILCREKRKGAKRRRSDLADSIGDILFNLLILAKHYGVDLNKEYPKVLEDLKKRSKNGDFD
jgi:NTP pyrophosphatase (non-canonical NTP hydrolase)